MTWGSSHAQLPRAAGPRWCQRGWPPRRGSWVLPKKKREARKGPATATDASYIDTPHIRCSFFHSRRWQSSVQGESRPYKGRARKTSNHSDLNELISGSGVRICLDLVYVVPLLGFFFFFCHKDRMKSELVVLRQVLSHDFSSKLQVRWKMMALLSFVKWSKPHVYIQKWSAGTRCDTFCIFKPWLKVCYSQPFVSVKTSEGIELHFFYEWKLFILLTWNFLSQ